MTVRVIWEDEAGRELFAVPLWTVDATGLGALLTGLTRLGAAIQAEAETPDAITVICRKVPRGTVSHTDVDLRH